MITKAMLRITKWCVHIYMYTTILFSVCVLIKSQSQTSTYGKEERERERVSVIEKSTLSSTVVLVARARLQLDNSAACNQQMRVHSGYI